MQRPGVEEKLPGRLYSRSTDGRTLILTANVVRGWRRERRSPDARPMKTYCFSEVVDAAWQGGTIRSQLSAFPRPGGLTEEWAAPPNLALAGKGDRVLMQEVNLETGESTDDCCMISASDGILTASVDLLNESDRTPRRFHLRPNKGGHLMFERLYDYALISGSPFSVNIQLLLTFKPPQKPAPIERSFWNAFLPGGRPESNRRKF